MSCKDSTASSSASFSSIDMRTMPFIRPWHAKPRFAGASGVSRRPRVVSCLLPVSRTPDTSMSGSSLSMGATLVLFSKPMYPASISDFMRVYSRSTFSSGSSASLTYMALSTASSRSLELMNVWIRQKPFAANSAHTISPKTPVAPAPAGQAKSKPPSSGAGGYHSRTFCSGTPARTPLNVSMMYFCSGSNHAMHRPFWPSISTSSASASSS
mmetsp:Transcript_13666/g.38826  ORF Transcript_13666/g.38826 Transcript_13666/m.38826 type:complete len:212 (-) Transcript_13666:170-805(-)